jgi:hypothetical protein
MCQLIASYPAEGKIHSTFKSSELLVTVTAYCPCKICCGRNAHGETYTGEHVHVGGVAVFKRRWIGKRITLVSRGNFKGRLPLKYLRTYRANDKIGTPVGPNNIDIFVRTHAEAERIGTIRGVKARITP